MKLILFEDGFLMSICLKCSEYIDVYIVRIGIYKIRIDSKDNRDKNIKFKESCERGGERNRESKR